MVPFLGFFVLFFFWRKGSVDGRFGYAVDDSWIVILDVDVICFFFTKKKWC